MPQWTHQVDMGMMSPAQASVAQLDRVLPSEGRGRGFESRQVRHINEEARQCAGFFVGVRWVCRYRTRRHDSSRPSASNRLPSRAHSSIPAENAENHPAYSPSDNPNTTCA